MSSQQVKPKIITGKTFEEIANETINTIEKFFNRLENIESEGIFEGLIDVAKVRNDRESIRLAEQFVQRLIEFYLTTYLFEMNVKSSGHNILEFTHVRGIVAKYFRYFTFPFLVLSKRDREKTFNRLVNSIDAINYELQELNVKLQIDFKLKVPARILFAITKQKMFEYEEDAYITIFKDKPVKILLEKMIYKLKQNLSRLAVYYKNIIDVSKFYPEITICIAHMRDYLHFLLPLYDGKKILLSSLDLAYFMNEMFLLIHMSDLFLQFLKQKKYFKPWTNEFKGVVWYFRSQRCSGCKQLERIVHFWDMVKNIETRRHLKLVLVERESIDGNALFESCFIKATPSLLYGITLLHGIQVPEPSIFEILPALPKSTIRKILLYAQLGLDEKKILKLLTKKEREEITLQKEKEIALYFRKIYQMLFSFPINPFEYRSLPMAYEIHTMPIDESEKVFLIEEIKRMYK